MKKETIKNIAISIFRVLKNNFLYIIWFILCFLMSVQILQTLIKARFPILISYNENISLTLAVYMYILSIIITLSPLGEYILRFINGVRKIETEREKEYLIPLFKDVYNEAKKLYPQLSKKIELCIMDAMYINAFALGRKTVAVTTGAISSLSEDELKGFIAHEIGHILNGDTKAILFVTIGNGMFSLITIILRKIIYLIDTEVNIKSFTWWVLKTLINICLIYFAYLMQITLSINSRKNEFRADKFAYEIGYGNNLKDSLYLLQRMCISDKSSLVDKLRKSHPNIAKRIGKLEKMINEK